jgi:hypothetical protein
MFLALAVLGLFIVYGTIVVAERRAIGEVDRKFLDDIVRQQSQDTDTLSAPQRNIGTVSENSLSHPAALRAALVVNSAIVRHGELVVHSGVVKRNRPSITTSRQNSQGAAESGRRLN